MSGAATTDRLRRYAEGELPAWAEATTARREHMARVAALLASWADDLDLSSIDTLRVRAVGWLHDALRDASPATLRSLVPPVERDLPEPLLHGPAAASKLAGELEEEMVHAIRHHTTGHPTFGRLGRMLYLADYLEPGRTFDRAGRAELRGRMPESMDEILVEVVRARMIHQLEKARPLRPEPVAFWSSVLHGREAE